MAPSEFADELVALLPRLRRFATSLTGSTTEADDIVQAACERALRACDQFTPGTRLDSWLFRIIRNLWIDDIRKRKTEGVTATIEDAIDIAGEDGRRATETALALNEVTEAMSRLPEDQRVVLLLVCAEDRSYQDAADTLGVPIGTVMSRLARARRSLAAALHLDTTANGAVPAQQVSR